MTNEADYKQAVNSGKPFRGNPEPRLRKTREGAETGHGSIQYVCKYCGKSKPEKEFYKKDRKPGRMDSTCKACRISQARERTLGITDSEYWELYHKQTGRCGICNCRIYSKRYKKLCVDHDHKTGEIRGLLCSTCNLALGGFRDDPVALRRAAEWVEGTVRSSEQSESK